jgi:hypothetical protein
MGPDDEVRELLAILDAEEMMRATARDLSQRFGEQARNAVIARVAAQFTPPPSGRVLARLELIVTDEDRPALVQIYLANLRSPDPQARQASLDGLTRLGYPHVADLAKAALRDDFDPVVASAARILAPLSAHDPALRTLLVGVRAEHADDPAFHMTSAVLSAHGIGEPS